MASQLVGRERRDFWILTLGQFLMFVGYFSFFTFPIFIKSVGGGEVEIGITMGVLTLAAALFIPWLSALVEWVNLKRLLLVGLVVLALATLACLTLREPGVWMASLMVLRGLGFGLYIIASGTYVARILPAGERSRWIGVNFGFNQIAIAMGPGIGEFIILRSHTAFFLVSTGFVVVATGLMLLITNRPPDPKGAPRFGWGAGFRFFGNLMSRDYRYVFFSLLLMACGLGAVFNFSATFLRGMGLSSGLFFAIYAVLNAVTRIGGGGVSDRYGRATVVLPALAVFAGGLTVYSFAGPLWPMVVAATGIGLGFGFANPALIAQLLDRAPSHGQGTAIAGFHFAFNLGMLLSTPMYGVIADALGYRPMWRVAAGMLVISTLIYLLMERKGERPAPE